MALSDILNSLKHTFGSVKHNEMILHYQNNSLVPKIFQQKNTNYYFLLLFLVVKIHSPHLFHRKYISNTKNPCLHVQVSDGAPVQMERISLCQQSLENRQRKLLHFLSTCLVEEQKFKKNILKNKYQIKNEPISTSSAPSASVRHFFLFGIASSTNLFTASLLST